MDFYICSEYKFSLYRSLSRLISVFRLALSFLRCSDIFNYFPSLQFFQFQIPNFLSYYILFSIFAAFLLNLATFSGWSAILLTEGLYNHFDLLIELNRFNRQLANDESFMKTFKSVS